jgi:hypothetical protein
MREEAHRRWPEGCSERVASKANDPSKLGLAEKKQKSIKLACRVFALSCPIRAANALRANFLVSVFIRVISGFKFLCNMITVRIF